MSVYRCYSRKKEGFDVEAQGLCRQIGRASCRERVCQYV